MANMKYRNGNGGSNGMGKSSLMHSVEWGDYPGDSGEAKTQDELTKDAFNQGGFKKNKSGNMSRG